MLVPNKLLIIPCLSKITAKTIPIAIPFVTYGKKNTVCKNFWNHLMELRATAIINAKKMDKGTVTKAITIVFGIAKFTKFVSNPLSPFALTYSFKPRTTPKLSNVKPVP